MRFESQAAFRSPLRFSNLVVLIGAAGCAVGGGTPMTEVSPEELPTLEAQAAQSPNNANILYRFAAGLFATDQCDSAVAVAARATRIEPGNALGPLIAGPCLERRGLYDEAIAAYARFAASYPQANGLSAVRARELIARRAGATQSAREAISREAELTTQQPNPQVIAVLPLAVSGDSTYRPLSRGLAQMIMSDLSLLRTFRLVERLQIGALMDELELAQSERVDATTAARVGQLVSAGRMVQGLANIPDEQNVRLEASVVLSTGEVTDPHAVNGPFRNLIQMEKELVTVLAIQLGYRLSEAERQLILENGTQNMAAFLAYSRGLEAQELGNYSAAAVYFGNAVQADPNFREARSRQQASASAPAVQQASPGQVTTLAGGPAPGGGPSLETVAGAVQGALGDLASTHTERTTESANETVNVVTRTSSSSTASEPPPPDFTPTAPTVTTIRIIFRLP